MKIPNLRKVDEVKSLEDTIKTVRLSKNFASLWQNLNDGRVYFHSTLLDIDHNSEVLKFIAKDRKFAFNSLAPLYIYFPFKCTVFKTQIIFNSHFKVEVKWPSELMTQEMRSDPRFFFDLTSRSPVEFIKELPKLGSNKHYKRYLLDLSSQGLSFKVSAYDAKNFYQGDPLSIIRMAESRGSDHIYANINYIQPIKDRYRTPKYFRVGVKFENPVELL